MPEQVSDALGVENVAAAKFDDWVGAQLTCVANAAQVFLSCTTVLRAVRLEAGRALGLAGDTATGVPTGTVNPLARSNLIERSDMGRLRLCTTWTQEMRA